MEQKKSKKQGNQEQPEAKPASKKRSPKKHDPEKSAPEKPSPGKPAQDKPTPEKASPEKPSSEKSAEEKKASLAEMNKVKLLFRYFETAFSSMKLYPPGNPSIKKSVSFFSEELREFLEEFGELRIGVGEFNFSYKGEIAFQDEEKMRSLPFFLFKDGMRELTFYKGLESKEVQIFLDTLKEAIDLPPEESDTVGRLWEKDFVNIRYYALDEFLDLDIGGKDKSLDFDVDPKKFSGGKIDLTAEDYKEFKEKSAMLVFDQKKEEEKGVGEGDLEGTEVSDPRVPTIKPEEVPEIEALIAKDKEVSSLSELVALLFEILFSEENLDQFSDVIKILDKYLHEVLHKDEFSLALTIFQNIFELKENVSDKSKDKVSLLEKVEKNAKDERSLGLLKKLYLDDKVKDVDSFFNYLELLGSVALPVVGTIWGNAKAPSHKDRATNLLTEMGKEDFGALFYLAKGSNLALAKKIISMMENLRGLKEHHHLEDFVQHPSKEIRLEAIRVLGLAGNEAANKILIKFLGDADDEVHAFAAQKLKFVGDEETFDYVMQLAVGETFRKRTQEEKRALLKFLAVTQKEVVYDLFRSILKKWSLFSAAKQNKSRLAAVSVLEEMNTPEAKEVLQGGSKVFGRTVRKACRLALSRMESVEKPPSGE